MNMCKRQEYVHFWKKSNDTTFYFAFILPPLFNHPKINHIEKAYRGLSAVVILKISFE